MSEKAKKNQPYQILGARLKQMRQKKQQSLAEVSGAVEIESETLTEIEQGITRPSEDILMLLISYFGVKDDEAVKLWEMAGYEKSDSQGYKHTQNVSDEVLQPVIVMPMDARIVYTDMAKIQTTKYGLTINFLQSDGIGGKPLAVARVGMSQKHAEKLVKILQEALKPSEQKLLPGSELPNDDSATSA